ncbi:MAG: ABC transporter permease subunit, partial [Planctomycetaceae bacterium]|nr:ABC transporter permease subunit [Planctomycetaceae bacterium]
VPNRLREGAYGLGANRLEVTLKVVVPAALSGIISAFLLALARAIGETMVVALAAGSTPTLTLDPRMPSQTMTGFIVETFKSESVVPGTLSYFSIYAVAAVLFLSTFGITLVGQIIRMKYREVYD